MGLQQSPARSTVSENHHDVALASRSLSLFSIISLEHCEVDSYNLADGRRQAPKMNVYPKCQVHNTR